MKGSQSVSVTVTMVTMMRLLSSAKRPRLNQGRVVQQVGWLTS